jgi:hypothetical protein
MKPRRRPAISAARTVANLAGGDGEPALHGGGRDGIVGQPVRGRSITFHQIDHDGVAVGQQHISIPQDRYLAERIEGFDFRRVSPAASQGLS